MNNLKLNLHLLLMWPFLYHINKYMKGKSDPKITNAQKSTLLQKVGGVRYFFGST